MWSDTGGSKTAAKFGFLSMLRYKKIRYEYDKLELLVIIILRHRESQLFEYRKARSEDRTLTQSFFE